MHAFLTRKAAGYHVEDTWDMLGMLATRSDDTVLQGPFVPDQYIGTALPAGTIDPFLLAMYANALIGFAPIYYAIAERARDHAITTTRRRTSLGLARSMAYHPWRVQSE